MTPDILETLERIDEQLAGQRTFIISPSDGSRFREMPFTTDNLKALATLCREQAETVERQQRLLDAADEIRAKDFEMMPPTIKWAICKANGKWYAFQDGYDGRAGHDTALAAFEALQNNQEVGNPQGGGNDEAE